MIQKKYLLVIIVLATFMPIALHGQTAVFYLKDYGCKGDGKTDDITALRKVASLVNAAKGGTIVFEPDRTYRVHLEDVSDERPVAYPQENSVIFNFRDCGSVKVEMNGSKIQMDKNHRMGYAFFHFLNCNEFLVSNGELVGDASVHNYSKIVRYGKTVESTHEWGHGIVVNGSRGQIKEMKISYMTGDGIKSGSISLKSGMTYHASLSVENTEISHCRRNGLSILSSLGTSIINTSIHHIGSYDGITGVNPMAGIDIEYEDKVWDKGSITINSCRITDCTRKTISASNSTPPVPKNLSVEACFISGSSLQLANVKAGNSVIVRDCIIENTPIHLGHALVLNTQFELGHGVHYVSGGTYRDCSFQGTLAPSSSVHGCSLAGSNLDMALFENCSFKDIRAANNTSPSDQGFSGYLFPLRATFKNCTFSNCSFVRGNPKYSSSFDFYDSTLEDGCMIYNLNDDLPINFERCKLTDVSSYQTQKGRFVFKKSLIEQIDGSVVQPLLLFGSHTMNRCTVVDNVGVPESAKKRHHIKAYKIDAKRTTIDLNANNVTTSGLTLYRGTIKGVSKKDFSGTQRYTRFK